MVRDTTRRQIRKEQFVWYGVVSLKGIQVFSVNVIRAFCLCRTHTINTLHHGRLNRERWFVSVERLTEAATIEVDLLSSAPIRTQRPEMQKKMQHKMWYVKSCCEGKQKADFMSTMVCCGHMHSMRGENTDAKTRYDNTRRVCIQS